MIFRLLPGMLLLALAPVSTPLRATPSFVYQSALQWLHETVHSHISASDRIYVLGPDRTTELYRLGGGTGTHDLETRLVVTAHDHATLAGLVSDLPFQARKVDVLVWRAGSRKNGVDQPVYASEMANALSSPFPLHADDIVELKLTPEAGTETVQATGVSRAEGG